MIKDAKDLPSATVAWAEDVAVDFGFRRDAVEVVAADEEDPNAFLRFSACGNTFVIANGHPLIIEGAEA